MLLYFQNLSIVNWSFRQMLEYHEPKYYLLIFQINNWFLKIEFIAKAEVLSTDL